MRDWNAPVDSQAALQAALAEANSSPFAMQQPVAQMAAMGGPQMSGSPGPARNLNVTKTQGTSPMQAAQAPPAMPGMDPSKQGALAQAMLEAQIPYQQATSNRFGGLAGVIESFSDMKREKELRPDYIAAQRALLEEQAQLASEQRNQQLIATRDALIARGRSPEEATAIAKSSVLNGQEIDYSKYDESLTTEQKERRDRVAWLNTPDGKKWRQGRTLDEADHFVAYGDPESKANLHYNVAADTYLNDPGNPAAGASIIPGSKLDIEQQEAAAQKRQAEIDATGGQAKMIADAENQLSQVERSLELVGNDTTGLIGWATSKIPGSDAYALNQLVDTQKAFTGFKALREMREASKTGGALGNVSNREIELLQNSFANLDPKSGKDVLDRSLKDIQMAAEGMRWGVENEQSYLEQGISASEFNDIKNMHLNQTMAEKYGVPAAALEAVKQNPKLKNDFYKKYGWMPR